MARVAASLAAVALALGLGACGGDGAEPGASDEATLVLDFVPNAVHAGIYTALEQGLYAERGVDLEVREPSSTADGAKLLAAGRTEFAILDINDLAIAREAGLDVVGLAPIVGRPLAAVIARDPDDIRRPSDLAGRTVGVTGVPSDDAVLDSVLRSDGVDPGSVRRVTIGFDSVSALPAARVDAATAFWNAEGIVLRRLDLPTREFRVDDYGAPRYPELVLAASSELARDDPELAGAVVAATAEGSRLAVDAPQAAMRALTRQVEGLDDRAQRAQLEALLAAGALGPPRGFDPATLRRWSRWAAGFGIVGEPPDVGAAFAAGD